jgi:hypothetical protein
VVHRRSHLFLGNDFHNLNRGDTSKIVP